MHFNLPFQPWLYAVVAIGVLWASSVLILGSSQIRNRRLRFFILGLRLAVLLVLLLILADPVIRKGAGSGNGGPRALLLVDTSRSMASGKSGHTRFDTVRHLLLERWPAIAPRVRLLSFDRKLADAPVAPADLPASPPGRSTHLAAVLKQAAAAAGELGAGDIVVFSDGRTWDRSALPAALDALRRRRIRVSVVPVGQPATEPDGAIVNCRVERQAPAGSRTPARVTLAFQGVRGETARLRLMNGRDEVADEISFPAAPGLVEKTLTVPVGQKDETFTVRLDPLNHESRTADNRLAFRLEVIDPTIRVLYMEGSNHKDKRWSDKWEYEFIADALRETKHIEVEVMTVDKQLPEGGRLYYVDNPDRGFPRTRREVYAYDVIICSDINRTLFSADQLEWVVDLVAKQGGGFCMIGGYTAFGAGKWDRTIWEKMIPVDMKTEKEGYKWEKIQPFIPEAVRGHPIWILDSDPEANARILEAHPPFLGMNLVNRAKPAATVLAVWKEKNDMPIICVQRYGRGRSMAFMSDAAGGWGEQYQTEWGEGEKDNRHYRRFWVNAVRWLAENSRSNRQTELAASTDAVQYRPGGSIMVTAWKNKLRDPDELKGWAVTARFEGKAGRPVKLTLEKDGSFRGKIDLPESVAPQETAVRIEATSPNQSRENARVPIRIVDTGIEKFDPTPDRKLLADLAALTGGTVCEPDKSDWTACLRPRSAATSSPDGFRQFTVPLWDRAWLWGLLTALLAAEWFLRKRLRLEGQ